MNTQMQVEINQADYAALTDDAAILLRPDAGVLILTGDDRYDFLHRMTTNHVTGVPVSHSMLNILTSSVARIQYVFTVVAQEDALLLLPVGGPADGLARHLRSQIFFMDNVQVAEGAKNASSEQSPDAIRLRYLGPNLDALENYLNQEGQERNLADMPDGAWIEHGETIVIKQDKIEVPGFELLIPRAHQERWIEGLVEAGARLLTDTTAYNARRIELGRPGPGHELTDDYNPLEVGLGWACADDKGCYTGQEIIARQVTYDKITKSLVGLRSDDHLLPEGGTLSAGERPVGEVTSSIFSPALDAPIALAVVRRPHNVAGTTLSTEEQTVTVVDLPFGDV